MNKFASFLFAGILLAVICAVVVDAGGYGKREIPEGYGGMGGGMGMGMGSMYGGGMGGGMMGGGGGYGYGRKKREVPGGYGYGRKRREVPGGNHHYPTNEI
ncbi:hypothetical protein WR25_26868 [Diploscapter pachys]|uniref:Uncharacterized protein n=1 Tax=Diploscapter pachys TaxID=2018661 RepID=A0A2A2L6Q7_9BILA|nr:hypothetical protein WR25_26868 [Diploscapter pachys]